MDRRDFLGALGGLLLLPVWPADAACRLRGGCLRFGVVTDAHYAERDASGSRYYRASLDKMRAAVERFRRADLDFIIELGDLKDMRPDKDPQEALRFLDDIEAVLQTFRGPVYHVLGNHDMDCLSKEEFLSHTCNPKAARGQAHYAFSARGVRCIVLDANFNEDGSDYCRGNFHWTSAWLPEAQLSWLAEELDAHRRMPTVVFLHQMLDRFSDISPKLCVGNADRAVALLESHPQVMAIFQGHHHPGHYSRRGGIHYVTFGGMIEGPFPAHNCFATVEIHPDGHITIDGFGDCPDRLL